MATKKWYRLTPNQIAGLDKDSTIVILPLGTMGSFDPSTRLWEDYKSVQDDAASLANQINSADTGPLAPINAVLLMP